MTKKKKRIRHIVVVHWGFGIEHRTWNYKWGWTIMLGHHYFLFDSKK